MMQRPRSQEWVGGRAIDSGPAQLVDFGPALLSLDADGIRDVAAHVREASGRGLEILADEARLSKSHVSPEDAHDGPYTVSIREEDFTRFLEAMAIPDTDNLTDVHVADAMDTLTTMRTYGNGFTP